MISIFLSAYFTLVAALRGLCYGFFQSFDAFFQTVVDDSVSFFMWDKFILKPFNYNTQMKQQSKPYDNIRQNRWKQNRKKQHQAIFQQKRKQMCQFHQLQQKELFNSLYPKVDEDNYREHKHTLKCFSLNNDYNFMLLAFTGLVYDHLLQNPSDQDSWTILEQISQFQEIQIPQTQQFVTILIKSIHQQPVTALTIIYNLLNIHRYQEILRNELLDQNYLNAFLSLFPFQRSQQQKQHIIYLHVSSCCIIASSHPALEDHQAEVVFNHLNQFVSDDDCKELISEMFSRINTSFKPSFAKAKALSAVFLAFSQTNYKLFETQMIHFFTYLYRSEVGLPPSVFLCVSESLESPNTQIIKQALRFIALVLKNQQNSIFCSDEVMKKVISIAHHFKEDSLKEEIIRVLTSQLTFKMQNCSQQLIVEEHQHFYSDALVQLLLDAIHSSSIPLIKSATFFIIFLIGHIKQTLNVFILQIYHRITESGLLHEIQMMENPNQQVNNQCDLILRLWESQQK